MSRAIRSRSCCSSHLSFLCSASWAISRKLNRMTSPHMDKSAIWNHPVCQKKTRIGSSVGILLIFTGMPSHGLAPNVPTTVAGGQASGASVLVSQCLISPGTILQAWSDFISMSRPSDSSIRKPRTIPAYEVELNATTARTCLPGDNSGVRLKSCSSRHSAPCPNSRPSRNSVNSLSAVINSRDFVTAAKAGISNDLHNRHVCRSNVFSAQIQAPKALVGLSYASKVSRAVPAFPLGSVTSVGVLHHGMVPSWATTVADGQAANASVCFCQPIVPSGTILQLWSDFISMTRPSDSSILKPSIIPAAAFKLNPSTARVCLPPDNSGVKSKLNNSRHSAPCPNSRPSRNSVNSLSAVINSRALVTVAEAGISNDFHNRHVCRSKVFSAQIQAPSPLVGLLSISDGAAAVAVSFVGASAAVAVAIVPKRKTTTKNTAAPHRQKHRRMGAA